MVEFQFIAFYGIIATLLDISQNGRHRIVQL
jgi:hypothetical protein